MIFPDNLPFDKKVDLLKKRYFALASSEEKYIEIIEMGRKLPPLTPEAKKEENLVRGCQSRLYLHSWTEQGKIFFAAEADALISAGLAALLIDVYSGETPETILQTPPDFLNELGIYSSLSLNRSNGLAHIHLRMKQDALKSLVSSHLS